MGTKRPSDRAGPPPCRGRRRQFLTACGALLLSLSFPWLGGCPSHRQFPLLVQVEQIDESEQARQVALLLWYFRYLEEFPLLEPDPDAALNTEYERVRDAFDQHPTLAGRIKLAWLLSLAHTPFHDPERAIALLDEFGNQRPAQPTPLVDLAWLLRTMFTLRRQQAQAMATLQRRLYDARQNNRGLKQRNTELVQDMETLRLNNRGLKRTIEGLQGEIRGLEQQIEALTTIEKTIHERTFEP